jgi:hypothetical protein
MTKLNDTQALLLSHASQAASGSLVPLPTHCGREDPKITMAIVSLLRRKLVEERKTSAAAEVWREGDETRTGLFITPAGLSAIGVEAEGSAVVADDAPVPPSPATATPRTSKITGVLELLQRPRGASIADIIAATDWLPHSTRAALTGLRKKGHSIERFVRDEVTCYRIAEAR